MPIRLLFDLLFDREDADAVDGAGTFVTEADGTGDVAVGPSPPGLPLAAVPGEIAVGAVVDVVGIGGVRAAAAAALVGPVADT
jgi:hypothetical protein